MRAHIIEPVGGHGGMNYYNNGLATGLLENGGKITLFTCDKTHEHSSPGFEIEKPFKKIYGNSNKAIRALRYCNGLLKSIFRIKRDGGRLCHLHFFQYGLLELITCTALRAAKIRTIATVHDVEAFSTQKISAWQSAIFKLCSELIVHNEFSRKELKKVLETVKIKTPITTIPHGNYLPFIRKKEQSTSRENLGLPQDSKIILFFGQIKKVKGLDILINAMPLVLERHPDAVFLIAGKVWKDSFEQYQEMITRNGVDSSVIKHIRYIPDEQVDDYYCSANAVALPYRKIYQSGVLLMAMSYGCTTVSSGLEPMQEVIEDGVNGYIFNPDSPASLAEKIIEALEADDRPISTAAIETMKTRHDWALIGKKHIEVYKRHA